MKQPRTSKECAEILRAMGDGTRLRILRSLLCHEQCVNDLAHELDLPQPHVSHHLQVLRHAGLVEGRRDGQRICYRLVPSVDDRPAIGKGSGLDLGCCRISFR